MMKSLLFRGLIVLLFGLSGGSLLAQRPNLIVINIDDLGYADIGPFGSNNRTPQLDRMAREGRKLTSHYAAPVCSPSRAALMTGSYPKRVLPLASVLFPAAAVGLNPNEVTVAEVLKDAGYATACFGKWHLGDQAEFLPTRQGFETYFGIPYSNDMGDAAEGSKNNPGEPLPTAQEIAAKSAKGKPQSDEAGLRGYNQPPLPLLENDKVVGRVGIKEQYALTRLYTERAVAFIRERREQPFFLYLPHAAVHFPLYPSKNFTGKSPNGLLGDWVEEVDWSVGQVLDAVRAMKLGANTFVIFTSDNGGSLPHGAKNLPLRGTKGQTLEGGIRTCTLAWWPGKIPAGTSTDAMTSMMDILPTFAGLAGGKLPTDRKLDGVDIWPVLAGNPAQPPRDHFFYYRGLTLEAVRSGPWKMHLALAENAAGKKSAPQPQLFNLGEDLGETKNVATQHPEVMARLQQLAQTMKNDLGLEGIGPGCRALGRIVNPQPLIAHDGAVRTDAVGKIRSFPRH